MSLITCGSIHKCHEWFSNDSRGRQEIYLCLAVLLCEQYILPIRQWRSQDIDQVLLHEIIFFLRVFSISEVLSKITSIRSKLPTAPCWKRKETGKPTWFMSKATTDTTSKSFTVFFAR